MEKQAKEDKAKIDVICSLCGASRNKDLKQSRSRRKFKSRGGNTIPKTITKEKLPFWKPDTDEIKYKLCAKCALKARKQFAKEKQGSKKETKPSQEQATATN